MPILTTPALPAGHLCGREQPEIAGSGLTLRPWSPGDLDAVLTAYADPGIRQWHARSMDADEAREWIAGWAGRWRAETGAGWAVADECGEVVGQISIRRLDLHEALGEISYWVLPAARGLRIAPRALGTLTGWAFGRLGLHRLEVRHSTANPASCRVAELAGFAAEGTLRQEALHADGWHDMHLHGRISP